MKGGEDKYEKMFRVRREEWKWKIRRGKGREEIKRENESRSVNARQDKTRHQLACTTAHVMT